MGGSSGGGGSSGNPASPEERALRQEQADLIRAQRDVVSGQLETKNILDPLLFEKAGFIPELAGEDDPETVAKQQEVDALQSQLDLGPGERLKARQAGEPFKTNAFIQKELEKAQTELSELQQVRITGLSKEEDPQQAQLDKIRELSRERVSTALKGELPVSPRLLRDLDIQQRDIEEGLRRQLGRDFRTSTPAQETLQKVGEKRLSILDAARRGDLTFAEQLFIQQEQQEQAKIGGVLARGQAIPLSNQAFSNALANVSQGFNAPLASLRQERFSNISQPEAGSRGTTSRVVGGAIGAAGGALLGAKIGTAVLPIPVVGTAVGAVVGGLAGAFL